MAVSTEGSLELYHHGSSVCAARVRLVLEEKQLAWIGHYLDLLKGEQFSTHYLAINPKGVVPTLVHNGHIIVESTVICEYLDEVFTQIPLLPDDPVERAAIRVWTKAVDEDLHPACSTLTYVVSHRHTILRNGAQKFEDFLRAPSSESVESRRLKWQWIQSGLEAPGAAEKVQLYNRYLHKMEAALSKSDWLAGAHYTMADVSLSPYLNRLAMMGMDAMWEDGRLPRLEAWFAAIQARPSFKPALIDWIPAGLADDLATNGRKSWPSIKEILARAPAYAA